MISTHDYTYHLPEERIAKFPLPQRDQSKLLVCKNHQVEHATFDQLPAHIPPGALMVFNNTRVIPARLHFMKATGAVIEVFLLDPVQPSGMLLEAMQSCNECAWHCTIGNVRRWASGQVLQKNNGNINLTARLIDSPNNLVKFEWNQPISFAEVIDKLGETPLPPYLKQEAVAADKERYQTIYSQHEGAVAAPTAGLHFTPEVLKKLADKGVELEYLTLHVSAGTFQPVKTDNALDHTMHGEQLVVTQQAVERLLNHQGVVVPVGTTSMRTLESLYWMGNRVLQESRGPLAVTQNEPYEYRGSLASAKEALHALLDYMKSHKIDPLIGHTSIYIHPGYTFRVCDALITNFHQPGSTLMLLVAAFIGEQWKVVYESALENNYRFLSYGDSSLLWKQ
jgi:S-adenosylmethionine:tRNA ribosyltransferase-isomerase